MIFSHHSGFLIQDTSISNAEYFQSKTNHILTLLQRLLMPLGIRSFMYIWPAEYILILFMFEPLTKLCLIKLDKYLTIILYNTSKLNL